jgi:hypothetical protein
MSTLANKPKPKKRISFDVSEREHRRLKIASAQQGKTLKEYVMTGHILNASESALEKDWLRPEEDDAWQNL